MQLDCSILQDVFSKIDCKIEKMQIVINFFKLSKSKCHVKIATLDPFKKYLTLLTDSKYKLFVQDRKGLHLLSCLE